MTPQEVLTYTYNFHTIIYEQRINYMATKTFNISFPEPLADAIDKKAKEQFGSRSDFLRYAALKYLREEQEFEELLRYGKKIGQEVGFRTEKSVAQDISTKRRQNRSWRLARTD